MIRLIGWIDHIDGDLVDCRLTDPVGAEIIATFNRNEFPKKQIRNVQEGAYVVWTINAKNGRDDISIDKVSRTGRRFHMSYMKEGGFDQSFRKGFKKAFEETVDVYKQMSWFGSNKPKDCESRIETVDMDWDEGKESVSHWGLIGKAPIEQNSKTVPNS